MAVDLTRYGSVWEKLMYYDLITISRIGEDVENPDGTTHSGEYVPVHTDVPCKISFVRKNVVVTSEYNNVTDKEVQITMPTRFDVCGGDKVVVKRNYGTGAEVIVTGIVANPDIHPSHQEFLIKEVVYA